MRGACTFYEFHPSSSVFGYFFFFYNFPEYEKIPIKESLVSEKCNGPWNNKCDSISVDSQEKEIMEKSGIQFIKGILNVFF